MRKYEIFMLNSIFSARISSQSSEFRPIYRIFAPKMLNSTKKTEPTRKADSELRLLLARLRRTPYGRAIMV